MNRPGITRQWFLRAGALSFLGATHLDLSRLAGSAAFAATTPGKAKACILLWLEGGISHLDSWDVKANSGFRPIATNAPGVQISEIFPGVAKHMDKLSIIRSMRTQERNHPQGTIETLCGHRPNPALKFPSVGSIVSKELGSRDNMPAFVVVPLPTEGDFFNYEEAYRSGFLGPAYDSMILPDPSKPDFVVPDLSLPKSISAEAIDDRRTMLKIVDQYYRQKRKHRRVRQDGHVPRTGPPDDPVSARERSFQHLPRIREDARPLWSQSGGAKRSVGEAAGRGGMPFCYGRRIHAWTVGYTWRE